MEVLNGVVSKCITCSHTVKSSVVVASKTQLSFTNKGHLDYYGEAGKGKKGWNGVSTKKKIKLLKSLTKDLSTFSDLGFGFNFDFHHINQDSPPPPPPPHNNNNNSIIISQAAEKLLAQLKQLRTEEKKLKKKDKEDKKKKCKNSNGGSSSSESESSDSECDKVVDIKRLRNVSIVQPNQTKETYSSVDIPSLTTSSLAAIKGPTNEQISLNLDQECNNMILEATLNKDAPVQVVSSKTSNLKQPFIGKRIEVCMGGKCKKSGAPALLEELQKAIGDDGGVIGCKCMGKCKSAPNVKVSTGQTLANDSLRYSPTNPLYIGVGLEDVELIVATYFGEGLDSSIASVAS